MNRDLLKSLLYVVFIFGMLIVLGSCAGQALAQTETPTPERTPLFGGDDSEPFDLGDCDPALTGSKDDYDLFFQFMCGHCFPEPTRMIATGTPWPTAPVSCHDLDGDGICDEDDPDHCHDLNGDGICDNDLTLTPQMTPTPPFTPEPTTPPVEEYYLKAVQAYNREVVALGGISTVQLDIPLENQLVGIVYDWSWQRDDGSQVNAQHYLLNASGSIWGVWPTYINNTTICMSYGDPDPCQLMGYSKNGTIGNPGSTLNKRSAIQVSSFGGWGHASAQITNARFIYYGYEPTPEATPTEIRTPTATLDPGICNDSSSYYNGEGGGSGDDDDNFLPGMWTRSGGCLVLLPEKSFILSAVEALGLIDSWTGFQVCVRWFGIDDFSLFGITFNVLHFLATGGILGVIRRYLRG